MVDAKVYKDLLNYLSSDTDNRCECTYFIQNHEIKASLHVQFKKKRIDCTTLLYIATHYIRMILIDFPYTYSIPSLTCPKTFLVK